ncbi:MAG TPA: aminodeoxychorismate synthase component I [Capsulimonadaceae bacterium]|jgi:para-aminobenzoate synthetase/4-amino-4-deoxychorismate lyase
MPCRIRAQFDFAPLADAPDHPLCFEKPLRVYETSEMTRVQETIRDASTATARGNWLAGFVSYDASRAFGAGLDAQVAHDFPLVWFAEFAEPAAACSVNGSGAVSPPMDWSAETDSAAYHAAIDDIQRRIASGETYQVNYSHRLRSRMDGDPARVYSHLRDVHPASYSAFIDTGRHALLSNSPELFFEKRGGLLTSKPMKGTTPRGIFAGDDASNADRLRSSVKERAENVMIVDLMRNDFGKIGRLGSVRASSLFDVEPLPTVWQMTSTVECEVDASLPLVDILAATFPPGSVTGAPKPITTRIIKELESSPRKVYCGCIGYVTPSNDAVFNVAIRTVIVERESGAAECGVGGGITAMSTPTAEHQESLSKALFLTASSEPDMLLETMRVENGSVYLLQRHMARLAGSARRFGFTIDIDAIEEEIARRIVADTTAGNCYRMRLLVSRSGNATVELYPLAPSPTELQFAIETEQRIDRKDIRRYHKTADRGFYEVLFRRHFEADSPARDVLLVNSDGNVTEFTKGNIVIEIGGEMITPPVGDGLLPGVLRQELVDTGVVTERQISVADVWAAERVWFVNALRGWIPAKRGA